MMAAERLLILLSAGTAERRSATGPRAQALAGAVDWQRLAATLRARRLLGALGPRILEMADSQDSEAFAAAVAVALATGRRQGALMGLISLRVIDALHDAGIPCSPLKGALLGESIYGDPGRRASGDIDLLVAPEHLHAAVKVVRGLGYGAPRDHVDRRGLPLLHFALVHERDELPPVELHWRVHWYECDFARERLLAPSLARGSDWRPAPADELAALMLFYARDGFIGLRLAVDLSAWWDAFGTALEPGALERVAGAYPALSRALAVAALVAERVIGVPLARSWGDPPALGLSGRAAARLANPNPDAGQAQLYAEMGVIDALLMPPGDLRAFVRRQLLPPREVLAERARRAGRTRAASPVGHGARVLARYGLAMGRLARGPEAQGVP